MQNGFITIPRVILKYEIFQDLDALGFYTRLKCDLRFREAYIDGVEVGVNSILISKPELAKRTNMTVAKVKRLLKNFQELGGIRCENIRNKYTLITFLPPFLADGPDDKGGNGNPPPVTAQEEEYNEFSGNKAPCEKPYKEREAAVLSERGELKAYGRFRNIYLSDEEYLSLKNDYHFTDRVIEKLSAYLEGHPEKSECNHYAQLYRWLCNERERFAADNALGAMNGSSGNANNYTPDPNASYDLLRAEERARKSVPKQIRFRDGRVIDVKKLDDVQ